MRARTWRSPYSRIPSRSRPARSPCTSTAPGERSSCTRSTSVATPKSSGARPRTSSKPASCAGRGRGGVPGGAGDEPARRTRRLALHGHAVRGGGDERLPAGHRAPRGGSRSRVRHPLHRHRRHDLRPLHRVALDALLRRRVDPHAGWLPRLGVDRQIPGARTHLLMGAPLGIALLILGASTFFASSEPFVAVRGGLAIVFQMLTTPGATYLLAHASYATNQPRHERTEMDELRDFAPVYPDDEWGHE